jgi:hypothetical protein
MHGCGQVVVCTSVLEEGLDVETCDVVVLFSLRNKTSLIQVYDLYISVRIAYPYHTYHHVHRYIRCTHGRCRSDVKTERAAYPFLSDRSLPFFCRPTLTGTDPLPLQHVQSRGRARAEHATFVLLLSKEEEKAAMKVQAQEDVLVSALKLHTAERDPAVGLRVAKILEGLPQEVKGRSGGEREEEGEGEGEERLMPPSALRLYVQGGGVMKVHELMARVTAKFSELLMGEVDRMEAFSVSLGEAQHGLEPSHIFGRGDSIVLISLEEEEGRRRDALLELASQWDFSLPLRHHEQMQVHARLTPPLPPATQVGGTNVLIA